MMVFSSSNYSIAIYIAFLHISSVIATVQSGQIFDSPTPPPAPAERVFDVTEYGAVADGGTESRWAFLAAWDAACNHPGRSTLYIPEGTFHVDPIAFQGPCHNDQSPKIELRGTLLASPSLSDFPSSKWIVFRNLHGVTLTGGSQIGKIDGQGAAEAWKQLISCKKSMRCNKLVTSLSFFNVSYGAISNISLSNSKGFHLTLHHSNNIDVYNVNITSPWDSPNTDGIHVGQSFNINIASSTIGVGDDCISIGPGSVKVSVYDVLCGPGHGISVGSLGRYKNEEDVVGISVQNCTIIGTQNGVRVKTWPGSPPSRASNIIFQDILMLNVSNPIIIDQEYCPWYSCRSTKPSLVKLSNIVVKSISGSYNTESAASLLCSSEAPCTNIYLIDINLNSTEPETPQQARLTIKGNLDGLQILSSNF